MPEKKRDRLRKWQRRRLRKRREGSDASHSNNVSSSVASSDSDVEIDGADVSLVSVTPSEAINDSRDADAMRRVALAQSRTRSARVRQSEGDGDLDDFIVAEDEESSLGSSSGGETPAAGGQAFSGRGKQAASHDDEEPGTAMSHFGLMLQQELREEEDAATPGLGFLRTLQSRGLLRVPVVGDGDSGDARAGTASGGWELIDVRSFLDMGRRLSAVVRFSLYLRMLALHLVYRHAGRYLRARPRSEDSRGWVLARDAVEALLSRHAENVRSAAWQQKGTAAAAADGASAKFALQNALAGRLESAITASAVASHHLPGLAIATLPQSLRPARCGLCNRRMPARLALTMFSIGAAAWHPTSLRDEHDFRGSAWARRSQSRSQRYQSKKKDSSVQDPITRSEWLSVPLGWEASIPRTMTKHVSTRPSESGTRAAIEAFRTQKCSRDTDLHAEDGHHDFVQVPSCAWYETQSSWSASASPVRSSLGSRGSPGPAGNIVPPRYSVTVAAGTTCAQRLAMYSSCIHFKGRLLAAVSAHLRMSLRYNSARSRAMQQARKFGLDARQASSSADPEESHRGTPGNESRAGAAVGASATAAKGLIRANTTISSDSDLGETGARSQSDGSDSDAGEVDASDWLLGGVKGAGTGASGERSRASIKQTVASRSRLRPEHKDMVSTVPAHKRGSATKVGVPVAQNHWKHRPANKSQVRAALPASPTMEDLARALSGPAWQMLERTWYQRLVQLQTEATGFLLGSSKSERHSVRSMLHHIAECATNETDEDAVAQHVLDAFSQRIRAQKRGGDESSSDDELGSPFRKAKNFDLEQVQREPAPRLASEWLTASMDAEMTQEGQGLIAFRDSLPAGGFGAHTNSDASAGSDYASSDDSLAFMLADSPTSVHSSDEDDAGSSTANSHSDSSSDPESLLASGTERPAAAQLETDGPTTWDSSDDDHISQLVEQARDIDSDGDEQGSIPSKTTAEGGLAPLHELPPLAVCRYLVGPRPKPPAERKRKRKARQSSSDDDQSSFSPPETELRSVQSSGCRGAHDDAAGGASVSSSSTSAKLEKADTSESSDAPRIRLRHRGKHSGRFKREDKSESRRDWQHSSLGRLAKRGRTGM